MKFIANVNGENFPFEVEISQQGSTACHVALKGLPMEKIIKRAQDAEAITVSTEGGKDSHQIHLAAYKYASAKLFLKELEELLKPLRQVRVAPIQLVLDSAMEHRIRRAIEEWALPIAAGEYMSRKLNAYTPEQMREALLGFMPTLKSNDRLNDDRSILHGWRNIGLYLVLDEIHPEANVRSLLSDLHTTVYLMTLFGPTSFHHPFLARKAANNLLYVKWIPVPFVHDALDYGFSLSRHDNYDQIQIAIKYNWVEYVGSGVVHAKIGPFSVTTPTSVAYRLYDDGRFTVIIDFSTDEEVELDVDPVSVDIPDRVKEKMLLIPILDVETLDMMLGQPTTFKNYADYNIFTGISLPVWVTWNSPMEAMFVLDRMATMLTSGMVIPDYRKPQVDEDGNVVPFRFVHPHVLQSLLGQVLLDQYVNKEDLTLNRIAYAWLILNRQFRDPLKEFPWQKVTVGGWRDTVAFANSLSHKDKYTPLLQRSFPTIDQYICERKAVAGSVRFPVTSDDTVLLERPRT